MLHNASFYAVNRRTHRSNSVNVVEYLLFNLVLEPRNGAKQKKNVRLMCGNLKRVSHTDGVLIESNWSKCVVGIPVSKHNLYGLLVKSVRKFLEGNL